MSRALNRREKMLVLIVGTTVAMLVNLFLVSFFLKTHRRLRADFAQKQSQLQAMQALSADRALWEQREAWLQAKQPRLENEATAGGQLLDQVKELGRKHEVLLEQQAIGTPDRSKPERVSVPVTFEMKSSWKALGLFLYELQGPGQFVVIESANLRIDPQDQTQMRGKFRIAKWYASR